MATIAGLIGLFWSLDGRQVIGVTAESIYGFNGYAWNPQTGKQVEHYSFGTASAFVWNPIRTRLAVGNSASIAIVNASTFAGETRLFLPEPIRQGDEVGAIDWHPDGTLIAGASLNGMVRIWKVSTGEIVFEEWGNEAHLAPNVGFFTSAIHSLRFSHDGRYLNSVSADGTLRTWAIASGEPVLDMRLETPISASAWNESGTQLAYAENSLDPAITLNGDTPLHIIDAYPTLFPDR